MADEQAQILAELIDRKIDARVSHIETMMEKIVRLIKRMRETSSPERLEQIEKELKVVKETTEAFDFKTLEKDLIKQLHEIKRVASGPELHRDIEQLKTKTQWLELEVEKMNVTPLLDRLNEIEARLDTFRLTQPTVIE